MDPTEEPRTQGEEDLPVHPALGCAGAIALGLLGATIVFFGAKLLFQRELPLGGGQLTPRRLWLVSEADNAGLALQTARIVEGSRAAGGVCTQTNVAFLLWRSDETAKPVRYCQCYERVDDLWLEIGPCESARDQIDG